MHLTYSSFVFIFLSSSHSFPLVLLVVLYLSFLLPLIFLHLSFPFPIFITEGLTRELSLGTRSIFVGGNPLFSPLWQIGQVLNCRSVALLEPSGLRRQNHGGIVLIFLKKERETMEEKENRFIFLSLSFIQFVYVFILVCLFLLPLIFIFIEFGSALMLSFFLLKGKKEGKRVIRVRYYYPFQYSLYFLFPVTNNPSFYYSTKYIQMNLINSICF